MRADLQALIDYTGLSLAEAAPIIGIGHDALSRKLAGRPRYDVRQEEVDALAEVAAWQDDQVRRALALLDRLRREHPSDDDGLVLLTYRSSADLPPDDLYPASVTRMVAARIKAAAPISTDIVLFDRATYDAWRLGAPDTRAARQDWAVQRSRDMTTRLSVKLGGKLSPEAERMAIGWALWRVGGGAARLVDRGVDTVA